ncbi:dihydropteroate synthase [Nocardioides sp.]|uniref:dihydropteroate synthase n=1 Tax=Nocardioides sp. TaxID=35761 RepID=UPI002BF93CF5|nr:dihydropteroate synthase [Nocardioides sp.]HSX68566.1 dihydropteroate synthase [Nocardioides sp.]
MAAQILERTLAVAHPRPYADGSLAAPAGAPLDAPAAPAVPLPVLDRTRVLGILNVTPDSFSDGGRFAALDKAVEGGLALVRDGADLVDVGGESTRPGAVRVDEDEELRRVVPVVGALAGAGIAVSVDTMRARVAEAAVGAGAVLVNDVSGGLADPAMLDVIAATGSQCVLMHWRGHSTVMESRAVYDDVLREVSDELVDRVDAAVAAGVDPGNIVLDPGLGFAKDAEQSWALLAAYPRLSSLGFPLLVGASRKRFLGECVPHEAPGLSVPADRDGASAAVAAYVAQAGAWGVRVHDVAPAAAAVRVAARLQAARAGLDLRTWR